jgi:heat shock protein HslJ
MSLCSRLALAGPVLAGLLSACASVSPAADQPPLDGTAWVLSSLSARALEPDTIVTLRFERGRAGGVDGCNRYVTSYGAEGTTLRLLANGASTQMACPRPVMLQAVAYLQTLADTYAYKVVDGKLHLLGADGALLATFAPQSQGVAGTEWQVTGYNNGRQAVVGMLDGTVLTMAFAADGKVSGSAGCNAWMGTYAQSGESLKFGPSATTRKMCAKPAGVMEQEQAFLKSLQTVASARQEGNRLELRSADGALAVSLARARD